MSYLPTIEDVLSKRDPAPNWRWVVRLPTSFVLTNGRDTSSFDPDRFNYNRGGAYGGFLRISALPFVIVENIDFQTSTIDSDARFGGGIRVNYPRFEAMSSVNLTLMESDNYSTMNYLKEWRRAVKDDQGNYGSPVNYKRDIKLFAFNVISNHEPAFIGTFKDCWPSAVSGLSYGYSSSGHVTVNAEFNSDKDEIETAFGRENGTQN